MQYRVLRTLEKKAVSAERNWLRNSLEQVVWEIEHQYRQSAVKALTVDPSLLADVRSLTAHSAATAFRARGRSSPCAPTSTGWRPATSSCAQARTSRFRRSNENGGREPRASEDSPWEN